MHAKHHRYLIVGAGPAGLQMGYFLAESGRDYLILERERTVGSFFAKYPVHRKLISINKKHNHFEEEEFNLRHDWNSLLSNDREARFTLLTDELFPDAGLLHEYLNDYARRFELNIGYDTTVDQVRRRGDGLFEVDTSQGAYTCDVLYIGTGAAKPKLPDVEGIELTTMYGDQETDPEFYRNKRVCIIGQGNSAFETAESISHMASYVHIFAKEPVKLAWDTHFVGDVRAVNNNIFDMYQLKSMHAVLNPRLRRISRLPDGTLQTNHEYDYPESSVPGTLELTREYDHIICCAGWQWMDQDMFHPSASPASICDGKYPEMSAIWESVNVPNMFFIGGAMQGRDRRASSAFIHGFRYNIRTLHNLVEERHEAVPLASEVMKLGWDDFLDWMYRRFSTSSALFQLFGVLADLALFSDDLSEVTILSELPVAHARQLAAEHDGHGLIFTLDFGFEAFAEPAISFLGPSDPHNSDCAAFLHPVIEHVDGDRNDVFHFGDSLLARWDRPHGKGGAVMSYHYLFQKWIEDNLGADLELPEPVEGGPYRRWTEAEIAAWRASQPLESTLAQCTRPGPLS